MDDKELMKVWTALDTRITSINDRTKAHTIQIQDLFKKIKELENDRT